MTAVDTARRSRPPIKDDDFTLWAQALARSGLSDQTAYVYARRVRRVFRYGLRNSGTHSYYDIRVSVRAYLLWTSAGRPMFQPGTVASKTIQATLKANSHAGLRDEAAGSRSSAPADEAAVPVLPAKARKGRSSTKAPSETGKPQ